MLHLVRQLRQLRWQQSSEVAAAVLITDSAVPCGCESQNQAHVVVLCWLAGTELVHVLGKAQRPPNTVTLRMI